MKTYDRIDCPDARGVHKIACGQWGNPDNERVLICVHGLTRNRHDFDWIAGALMADYRVICIDLPGRGDSDWLGDDRDEYQLSRYVADVLVIFRELSLQKVDWLGTSLGGIIGMVIASQYPHLIRRLVLNDVGASIPKSALMRIARYFAASPSRFETFAAVVQCVRQVYAPFGNLTDSQWEHLAKYAVKLTPEGDYRWHYDPEIARVFIAIAESQAGDMELWEVWKAIACPVLLLHGENSDLLLPEIIAKMAEIREVDVVHFGDCGHAPALANWGQIEVVRNWLISETSDRLQAGG